MLSSMVLLIHHGPDTWLLPTNQTITSVSLPRSLKPFTMLRTKSDPHGHFMSTCGRLARFGDKTYYYGGDRFESPTGECGK